MQTLTKKPLLFLLLLLALGAVHAAVYNASEPFFYNDETRHVVTGLYFRDLLHDLPLADLRGYTTDYYLQYPALGLLVWPPLFHALEGLLMSAFGTSMAVPLALVGFSAAGACAYLFLLVLRSHGAAAASVSVLVFGLAPLVFEYSRYVMLEVPTLALGLAATYHFVRFLDAGRRRDLLLAALFAALAALTRFDAVYLLPLFLILVACRRRRELLLSRDVLAAAAFALCLVLPAYVMIAREMGAFHLRQASETLSPDFPGYLSLGRYIFYPASIRLQAGLFALVPAAVGLIAHLSPARRRGAAPYYAMIAATYVTFTPLGEVDSRHAIYWLPALSFFAAAGLSFAAGYLRTPKLYAPLAALLVGAMAANALNSPRTYVRWYEEAARLVLAGGDASPFCLFVGRFNGNFIYQVRRHDPQRRLWVLRADKIFYTHLFDPRVEHRQFAEGEGEVLDAIFKYDPAYLVLEVSPQPAAVRAEQQVREAVVNHPERFRLEQTFPVSSNDPELRGTRLMIYRNVHRNPRPERRLDIELLMLGRSVQGVVD